MKFFGRKKLHTETVLCPYCHQSAALVSGDQINRGPHADHKSIAALYWICRPCDAWVKCHPKTNSPMGTIANAKLRYWRHKAHSAFDPLWRSSDADMTRHEAYEWLARQLKISLGKCHIGMFTESQCRAVVDLCNP